MPPQSAVYTSVTAMCRHAAGFQKQVYKHRVEALRVLSALTNRYN